MTSTVDRILTTHAGSLPRPEDLIELGRFRAGEAYDPGAFARRLPAAVAEIVARQREIGVDIVNDGEFGKAMRGKVDYGAWSSYAYERIAGWEPAPETEPPAPGRRERRLFPSTYDEISAMTGGGGGGHPPLFTGPISYRGHEAARLDVENLKAALEGTDVSRAFITAVAPGSFARRENRYYATDEEYVYALAEALREEYEIIAGAGFTVQLDDPGVGTIWDMFDPPPSLEEYRKHVMLRLEATNHALRNIPEERVRFHVCWGSWHGPHTTDIPLADIVDMLLTVKAGAYSVEAGNVRHEHEWRVWQEHKLPDGKVLIPGVVSHATNVVEHPQVVADRIVRYARVVGRERVIAGTDCGLGGRVNSELAWAKLRSLTEGAVLATQELWP